MATTALTIQEFIDKYPIALSLPAFTAADVANGNHYVHSGREFILIRNVDAGPHNFTLTSQPLSNRTRDITAEAIAGGVTKLLPRLALAGWGNGQNVELSGDNLNIEFAVIRV